MKRACVSCEHCIPVNVEGQGDAGFYCKHYPYHSAVTGEVEYKECKEARVGFVGCGLIGRWYEPRGWVQLEESKDETY